MKETVCVTVGSGGVGQALLEQLAGLYQVKVLFRAKNEISDKWFCLWGWDGTLDRTHDSLYEKCRQQEEREAIPTAAIVIALIPVFIWDFVKSSVLPPA